MPASDTGRAPEWHIITCEYPPTVGGVGDYTFTMASALSATGRVHVWCPSSAAPAPVVANVTVAEELHSFSRRELRWLSAQLDRSAGPRHLFVQWVPQGFGHRSLNIGFALWIAGRAYWRRDRVHLMVHEPFLPWSRNPVHLAMSLVHRAMLATACLGARHVWVSTPSWRSLIGQYVNKRIPIDWLPVPAPTLAEDVDTLSARNDSEPRTVGHFGLHSQLVTPLLEDALEIILRETDVRVLLVGRGSDVFRESFVRTRPSAAKRVRATGTVAPLELRRLIATCDVMVQPYPDGITARRTSALTMLSLGMPMATNLGHLSEDMWTESGAVKLAAGPDGRLVGEAAVALLADGHERAAVADRARTFYDERFAARHAVAMLTAAD